MIPGKKIKDKNSSPSASPPPSLQSLTRRKSHGEQINFRLPTGAKASPPPSVTTSSQKGKKHWRSPSNPLDFNLNCRLVAGVADIQKDPNYRINNSTMMIPSASTIFSLPTITSVTSPLAIPCQRPQQPTKEQFNFSKQQAAVDKVQLIKSSKFGDFEDFKSSEMTVNKKGNLTRHKSSLALYSYETMLLKGPKSTDHMFKMIAEMSISSIVSTGSSDFASTRRHAFQFDSSYCRADSSTVSDSFESTSLVHGHIDATTLDLSSKKPVTFSRCSLLQVILRNPQDNSVAGIFVVKLDLSDMPAESRTILRQKVYKSKCLADESEIDTATDYLSKFIEIPLKRSYDPEAKRQKIILAGPIRVAFSFNRSNLRYTSPRKSDASAVETSQKTHTVLQFPLKDQKYFPLTSDNDNNNNTLAKTNHDRLRSNSLTTESATRSFQHGSLCL